jgi:predicted enzyme related to lactoylglutathione lyase
MGAPFVWFDLATTSGDGVGVRDFYAQLFGWTIGPGMGDYQGFVTDGEQTWAGILPADAASAGRWIPYIVVDDLDAAAKQAVALGGRIVRDKTVGPAGASIVVTDPGGAAVALFTPAAR